MKKYYLYSVILSLGLTLYTGCGSSSSDGASTVDTPMVAAASGILVDPFIEGSILCEDVNKNGLCESGEQLSTATNAQGEFSFSNELTVGSHIITKEQGFHNNVPYTLKLSGIVDADGKIDIVSPLTTLQTKNLSAAQIRGLLENAGLTNLSDDDIFANPLEGGINSLNSDEKLKRLHSTLATYGLLRVMKGSKRLSELTSTELVNSAEVNQILTAMVSAIKGTLSKQNLDSIQSNADAFNRPGFTAPTVSVDVITKTAVTTMDALTKIAYETCNQTDGSDTEKVTAALNAMNANKASITAKTMDIGMQYYAKENKSTFSAVPVQFQSLFPAQITEGLNMPDNQAITISSDATIDTQSESVANIIMQAHADNTTKVITTLFTECPANAQEDQPHFAAGLDCDMDGGKIAFETPRNFKVAFKSMGLINQAGEKVYLFNKSTLAESIVYDVINPKVLGEMIIPQGTYTSAFAEVYYYWLDMQMYNEGEYSQFRIYMSDDNRAHATAGHHQGDVTITDINNSELGWLDPSAKWLGSDAIAVRLEPLDVDVPMYAATKDVNTSRQRGPFGSTEFWDNELLHPNDIFTLTENITLTVAKESKMQLTFKVKNSWYFEDYNNDGIFGAGEHTNGLSGDNRIIEAGDANASWAPLLGIPTLTNLY